MECDSSGNCSCREGFAGTKCDECLPNVIGDKCDKCQPSFFDYPSCEEGCPNWSSLTFSSQFYFFISDCKCNPVGSTTLDCGKINGECSCKETFTGIKCDQCIPNVIGDKCDACEPSFFNYPLCEGLSKLTIFNHLINIYFSDCMCDPVGSTSSSCDNGGKCTCKDGYDHGYGIKCGPPTTTATEFTPTTSDYGGYGGYGGYGDYGDYY